jgi:two-component system, chemotaxis family, CheB/CheR fusion protein
LEKSSKSRLSPSRFPIVGIGASAGGLAAFNELLAAIPADSGMAFVIVQHLDPTHTSMLAEAIARTTAMNVVTAASGTKVEPNHVYVIPPNADIALEGNSLQLVPREQSRKPHLAIDFFFRSLAAQRGAQAIGVVLSGSGSDGTEGLRAIKAEGGFTFAQAPKTAKFGDMPQSAIKAGVVDTGMPIPALARELVRLSRHPYVRQSRPPPAPSEKDQGSFEKVLALVRGKTGVDFSEYKRATIERRTARRMALRQEQDLEGYLRLLQTDDAEASALCEDVLIHVTSFFRDPAVFEAVAKEFLPQILESKPKDAPFRAWVAGCSTGEEVYSLAISLLESPAYQENPRPIQIFGSDVSEKAVEQARSSLFSDTSLRDLSEETRRKYFVRLDHGYRINKQVRELCAFVRHDLARDPPFARLDLVSCRNVLIYFGPALQKRLMATFHYCLNQPGFLVLGRSEGIGGYGQFFTLIDRENKIYSRTSARSVLQFAPGSQTYALLPNLQATAPMDAPRPPFDVIKHVDRLLLSKYVPAGVVLNEKLEVVQFRGRTGPYLEPAPGQPQTNVLKMAREGLLLPLKTALAQARKQRAPVRKHGIEVGERGAVVRCDLVVIPLTGWPGSKEPLYAVVFEQAAPVPQPAASRHGRRKGRASSEEARLKRELQASKEYLQSLLEEHSRVNDDLGTANEELTSGNEELQSMNEELQTAKEELQSANEELTTVNDELQSGNRELNLANSDLVNLLNTVEIPIVFLDAQRRIRRFTPQAQSVFNVLATDIGRPIDDIKPKIDVPDLDAQIAWSIANVTVRESQIQDQSRRWHRMQIRPYQTLEGKVDGAILSLVDIDVLKRHVDQAEWSRDYAVSVVDAVLVPLVVLDEQLHVTSANEAFYETFGVPPEETEKRSFFAVAGGKWNIPALRTGLKDVFERDTPFQGLETEGVFPRVGQRTMSFFARAVHFRDSRPMILLSIEDVSTRKQVEVERKRLLAEAQHARDQAEQANRTKDAFLATLSHELRTPLATMLMNAQLLRHADLPAAKVQRASQAIERSAKAQSQLIEDLLDVSRIVTGRLSLDVRRLSMFDVVQTAVEAAALQAERKQISIEAQLDPRTGQVSGDSLRLQQVVSNLLNNAIKFTPEHGEVKLFLGNEGGDALLRVSDTGAGIDPAFLPFVFDRFAQQENTSVRRFGGLGLGLSIVRHIVEMHGGSVRAESPGRGGGATLSVRIPLLRDLQELTPDEHVVSRAEAKPAIPELSRLRGLRVLLVDDDAETLEAVTEMLRVHGANVITARSAAEALRAAQETPPQVIVSDIAMPGTDGYGLIRSIRALPAPEQANVPAIALTAAAGANGRKRSLEAGFQEHLEKPVDIGRLAHALVDLSQTRNSA